MAAQPSWRFPRDLQQGDLIRGSNTDSAFVRTGSSSWRVGNPADHVAEEPFGTGEAGTAVE